MPFLARWPGRIEAGASSEQSLCLTDVLATTAELLNAPLPNDAAEDSSSFLPVLLGTPSSDLRNMTFIQGDAKDNAISVGFESWKLIESTNSNGDLVHNLYDLSEDPGETNDVAAGNLGIVQQLADALDKARRSGRTRSLAQSDQ